jgi:hypothetical protein
LIPSTTASREATVRFAALAPKESATEKKINAAKLRTLFTKRFIEEAPGDKHTKRVMNVDHEQAPGLSHQNRKAGRNSNLTSEDSALD